MLVGPAAVLDISAAANENADAMATVDDIMAWEEANGTIPEGAFVLLYSGWAEVLLDRGAEAFSGTDADGGLHFPGFSPEAAAFLVEERSIKGVGTDTLSLDHGPSATFDVHYTVLGAGLLGIENLNNLAAIKDTVATVVLGVPKYEAGSGGPLRVLAMT
jgi:kynurenine formamidase